MTHIDQWNRIVQKQTHTPFRQPIHNKGDFTEGVIFSSNGSSTPEYIIQQIWTPHSSQAPKEHSPRQTILDLFYGPKKG